MTVQETVQASESFEELFGKEDEHNADSPEEGEGSEEESEEEHYEEQHGEEGTADFDADAIPPG